MLRIPTTIGNVAEWARKSATTLNLSLTGLETAQAGIVALQTAVISAPVTYTTSFTVGASDRYIICNGAASITATLPDATTSTGRALTIKTTAAFTVVSATSNVVPLAGGAAGTAILAATAGKWVMLVSNGTSWVIMEAA